MAVSPRALQELRRLAILGGPVAARDAKLHALIRGLRERGLLKRLTPALQRLQAAPAEASGGALLACLTINLGALRTRPKRAPRGLLQPLDNQAPGQRSGHHRHTALRAATAALRGRSLQRAARLRALAPVLGDLRCSLRLPAALDDPAIAAEVERVLWTLPHPDHRLAERIQASWSRRPGGDGRRLILIHRFWPQRAHQLARKLLNERPRPLLCATIYRILVDDPEALPLLLDGTREGPVEVQQAAFGALARRPEPEAVAAIAGQLGRRGRPGRPPRSFELLREAFGQLTAPSLLHRMRSAVADPIARPPGSGHWTRAAWAEALARSPLEVHGTWTLLNAWMRFGPLLTPGAPGEDAPSWSVAVRIAEHAPLTELPRFLKRLPRQLSAWRPTPGGWLDTEVEVLLVAAARLPPVGWFFAMREDWQHNHPLLMAIRQIRHAQTAIRRGAAPEEWTVGPRLKLRIDTIRWDPRWQPLTQPRGLILPSAFDLPALPHAGR